MHVEFRLYKPPIVNSPKGNPHIIKTVNIITTKNAVAPIIGIIIPSTNFKFSFSFYIDRKVNIISQGSV